jgi:hypothetical protein
MPVNKGNGLDAHEYITQWQNNALDVTLEAVPEDKQPIAQLYNSCLNLNRAVITALEEKPRLSKANFRRIQRSYQSLCLWGKQVKISEGRLDEALQKSRSLRRSTLKLLISFGKALSNSGSL